MKNDDLFRMKKDTGEVKPTRYYSSRQESSVAKAIGGRKVANSGATPYDKGDVTAGDSKSGWLVECKTSTKDQKSFTLQKEWFDKNLSESIYMKVPHTSISISFGPSSKNYYIVDEPTFLLMKDLLDRYDRGEIEIED